MSDLFIDLRRAEFNCVKNYFRPGIRVLEIGGGNGFQARLLDSLGANVKSIDVAQPAGQQTFFLVEIYDGRTIPSSDAAYDVVFSSNVLEHAQDIDVMMAEIRRVLKVDGAAIHILPTPAWRFWTSVAHYAYLAIRIWGYGAPLVVAMCLHFVKNCSAVVYGLLQSGFSWLARMANIRRRYLNFGISAKLGGWGYSVRMVFM